MRVHPPSECPPVGSHSCRSATFNDGLAHNPEVAGSNPVPATSGNGPPSRHVAPICIGSTVSCVQIRGHPTGRQVQPPRHAVTGVGAATALVEASGSENTSAELLQPSVRLQLDQYWAVPGPTAAICVSNPARRLSSPTSARGPAASHAGRRGAGANAARWRPQTCRRRRPETSTVRRWPLRSPRWNAPEVTL